jgi:hypothetical protein
MARKAGLSSMTWENRQAFAMFVRGATVPAATRIALIVGTWLCLLNQGSVIVNGHLPWVKLALNYLTPFVVASLGFLAARRRSSIERLAALLRSSPFDTPST